MAKELFTFRPTGKTIYAMVHNTVGQVFKTTNNAFETYATANRADYDIALTEQGTASAYYCGDMDTDIAAGRYVASFWERAGASPAEGDLFIGTQTFDWTGAAVVSLGSFGDLYHADIVCTFDDTDTLDMYTVTWFKNGVRITTNGAITSPTIQLIKRSDGTDLLAATAMSEIGTTESYKYDSSSRVAPGTNENVIAVVSATIDSATRTFSQIINRDRTAA